MARIIRDLEITKIAATNTTNASTSTIMKADAAMPTHQQTLDRLEAEVARLEARVTKELKTSYSADEDWDDDGDDDTLNADDNNSEDDSDDEDDNDDDDVQKLGRHRFEALVDHVADRDDVDKQTAAERARQEYPKTFASYQRSGDVTKRAPSYDALVQREIAKGCSSLTVARQRVATLYPAIAARAQSDSIAKGGSVASFMHEVDQHLQQHGGSRVAAMEAVRKAKPELFKRYRNV